MPLREVLAPPPSGSEGAARAGCGSAGTCGAPLPLRKGAPGVLLMQTQRRVAKSAAGARADEAGEAADAAAGGQMPKGGKATASKGQSKGGAATTTAAPTTTTASQEAGSGAAGAGGSGAPDVMAELVRTREMIASLQEQVGAMTMCCGCNGTDGGGGGGGDKTGKWFRRPTTTRLNGPVSAGGAPTTTTLTTTESLGPPGLCAVFGDPHFITFDGGHTVLVGDMTIWLVKTDTVWIQALSKGSDGKFAGIAIGGSFMKGHTLILYNNTETGHVQTVFDGRFILNDTVDEYHEPGILDAHKDDEWDVQHYNDQILNMRTEAKFDIGDWHERFLGRPKGGLYVLKLPDSLEVTATGVDFMSSVITMPRPGAGVAQGGYCGNFNGDPEDDAQPVVPSWNKPIGKGLEPVERSLNLFRGKHSPVALAAEAALLEGRQQESRHPPGQREDGGGLQPVFDILAACSEDLKRQAADRCGEVEDARMQRDCVFDICATKDVHAADGMLAAEVLEEELNAKGIPVFMGHGLCADAQGRPYEAWETTVRTERECQDVLRSLALTKGILGAQLRRTASCQIIVRRGTDPTSVMIPGGWGKKIAATARGEGLVRGVTQDTAEGSDRASWSCWQLV